MKTDETIQAIDALPKNGRLIIDAGGRDEVKTPLTTAKITALAAELKLYREFVGAIHQMEFDDMHGMYGYWAYLVTGDVFRIYDNSDNILATGTDAFDAWRKMPDVVDPFTSPTK